MKNQKGYILISTLIIFSAMLIIGFTILGISVSNYYSKNLNLKSKQCFYLAESGLDFAYLKIRNEVQSAIEYAKNQTDNFIENYLKQELLNNNEYIQINILNSDIYYFLDKEKIEKVLADEFNKHYRAYFLGNRRNEFISNIKTLTNDDVLVQIENNLVEFRDGKIRFTLLSKYSLDDIQKEISSQVHISIPESYMNYKIDTRKIKKNLIYEKGIIAFNRIHPTRFLSEDNILQGNVINIDEYVNLENKVSIRQEDECIYIGKEDIILDENIKSGIIITQGNITINTNKFSGILISKGDIYIQNDFNFIYDNIKNIQLILKYDLFKYFREDNLQEFIFLETISASDVLGYKDVDSLIEYKNWVRRR
ncbi:hypothetical protein SAMN05661008_01283 [Alkalithermobacter thermoalcaliphilus JW-YL-7 = DSM 7308]|uniref:Uncharacterized protein n=1 Tax=Alkalithermobacter thermoalcaliphilus JW-YL-7 = DSM 7308 TaxID=1121328 RepID=A0A150FR79_CLOPD|nr:hypothetical protein JWYL7_1153 [[Clostridium] paradoxum JW-YL-7 = DSM 7308]SHL00802.1 hypothetical protein SAMN05661008_01283 [[Clostridium] paradoxum JW-YL-7 = DSM 7308]